MTTFKGFSQTGLNFLRDVRQRNDKTWFEENRSVYEEHLLSPFRALVNELSQTMVIIDPEFEVRPSIGKTLSRIYRDTRFSKDKSLFRSHMWLVFRRYSKEWTDAPVYFFEITPDFYRYGLGYYSATKSTMDTFRRLILKDKKAFLATVRDCFPDFEVEGESYKRPLIKDLPAEIAYWYNRKNFAVLHNSYDLEDLFQPDFLIRKLEQAFNQLMPLYQFLRQVEVMKRQQDIDF